MINLDTVQIYSYAWSEGCVLLPRERPASGSFFPLEEPQTMEAGDNCEFVPYDYAYEKRLREDMADWTPVPDITEQLADSDHVREGCYQSKILQSE